MHILQPSVSPIEPLLRLETLGDFQVTTIALSFPLLVLSTMVKVEETPLEGTTAVHFHTKATKAVPDSSNPILTGQTSFLRTSQTTGGTATRRSSEGTKPPVKPSHPDSSPTDNHSNLPKETGPMGNARILQTPDGTLARLARYTAPV
jgi:hypothetical protein